MRNRSLPPSADVSAVGGLETVAVTAPSGCTWTAVSDESWIAVTLGANGTGNGSVTLTVAPNPGTERTGTVVIGSDVRIGPAAVAHGNLSVKISTRYDVSQPAPYSRGETTVVPREKVEVEEGSAHLVALQEGATLADVVGALNTLGVTPRDIIAIMQALKESGALRADLVIM